MNRKLEEIRARCEAATPGPWMWDIRSCNHDVKLVTDHSGQYYVMGVQRWGTQGACVSFQKYEKYEGPVSERRGRGMSRADKLSRSIPGKEHHEGWDDYIDHPDAALIEHAPQDISYLLSEIDHLTAELEEYRRNERLTADHSHWKTRAEAFEKAARDFESAIGQFSFACFCCAYKDINDPHKCDLLGDEVCEDLENWEFDQARFGESTEQAAQDEAERQQS